ncbi:MAG: histidine kinase dimerization/phospho-acceptor domain-containing protein, partial [Candidatus Neomarinimicrobiota bacterium]
MRKSSVFGKISKSKREKRFPLVLYYTIASIVVVSLASFLVNYIFTKMEFERLLQVTERRAIQEADHLNTLLTYQLMLRPSDAQVLSLERLSDATAMDSIVQHPSIPENIAFFSVLDHDRLALYSTIQGTRGTIHAHHPGFELKRYGQYSTGLIDMPMENGEIVKLFEIYRSIYANPHDMKNPIGILKTYHYLEEPGTVFMLATTSEKILATVSTMGSLFLVLLGIVIHGQKVIDRSHLYLEKQVANRTKELSETNEKLVTQISERRHAEEQVRKLNEELEQRVKERTSELEAANEELESFSYSVSHDLRAPLRSIDGFSQILLEDYGGQLDDQGKDSLRRVSSSVEKMAQLIDDLLELSRVTRSKITLDKVNLTAMAKEVAAQLQETDPKREVDFMIHDGLDTKGDSHLLRLVMENFI